jgi:ABC-type sugar transport system substrate-binding protein
MSDDREATTSDGASLDESATTPAEAESRGYPRGAFLKRAALAGAGATVAGGILGAGELTAATSRADVSAKINPKYKGKKIGFAMLTASDENILSIVKYAKQAASAAGLGWSWVVVDTRGDVAAAQTTLGSFLTQKVNGTMMVGIGAGSVEAQLAEGKAAGIPMIGSYTFADAASSIAQDYTLPPDVDASLLGNYLIADQLKRHPKGTIKVAMLDFPFNVIQARRYAFEALIAQQSRVKVVAKNYTIGAATTAQDASKAAQTLLRAHPDLSAIWCNYPPIAVPAAAGVAQTGKKVQVYGHIANSSGVEAVRSGSSPLVATSWVDWPYVGYSLVDQMLEAMSGKVLNRKLSILRPDPSIVFDSGNVNREVPKGTKAGDWSFAGGAYRGNFIKVWNKLYA